MSDRGIKKWAPYKALVEQETSLAKMHQKSQTLPKPEMTEDKMEEINEILVNYRGESLLIKYYRNSKIIEEEAQIKTIDPVYKKIVLTDRSTILFEELVDLIRL